VQLYHGVVDNLGDITRPQATAMNSNGAPQQGSSFTYKGNIQCRASGQYGYAVRVMPKHPDLSNPFETGLITWG
jgi:starch phosphorylase